MFVSKRNSHYELLPTHKNVVLKDFWIDKFIPAKEAFAKINNYLLRVPEVKYHVLKPLASKFVN